MNTGHFTTCKLESLVCGEYMWSSLRLMLISQSI
uniref:Uncharacterized protein n=1 Tax=Anguilla anguilla TaxID=7936 RepID=A0A0E9X7W7_ANGAN